ncbi:MAG: protease modulator HflK N-terminal domain-containing protein, partial [Candidatus Puniceispirillum sp.]
MPWNNQGGQSGGPWGQGGGGGGPWGQGGGQNPQDVDAAIRQMKDAWGRMMPTGSGGMRSILLLFLVFAIVWA